MQKEPSFAVGDTVEVLTGDYSLWCGERLYSRETPGKFTVESLEYDMGNHTYTVVDAAGHKAYVIEEDLRRSS